MSFINYYPKPFDYELLIYCCLGIVLLGLLMWFLWARSYRYSSERIADKLSKKYNKSIRDGETILASDGKLNGNMASATITISDRNDNNTQELFTLPVILDCSILNNNCIAL